MLAAAATAGAAACGLLSEHFFDWNNILFLMISEYFLIVDLFWLLLPV